MCINTVGIYGIEESEAISNCRRKLIHPTHNKRQLVITDAVQIY